MFFVMSSIKLGRFRRNLVYSFLNKLAAKSCKRFPPHLNSVSTLPYETAHRARATTALSEKVTLEFIPPQLGPPSSTDLNQVGFNYSVWQYCVRG